MRNSYADGYVKDEQIQQVECPKCGARPGEKCAMSEKRSTNHMERVRAARRARRR